MGRKIFHYAATDAPFAVKFFSPYTGAQCMPLGLFRHPLCRQITFTVTIAPMVR